MFWLWIQIILKLESFWCCMSNVFEDWNVFCRYKSKKYLVYLFLASWEWFLQTSALQSASTEERLSGDFLLIKSCVYEFFGVDKKWPYETKNRYIGGWDWNTKTNEDTKINEDSSVSNVFVIQPNRLRRAVSSSYFRSFEIRRHQLHNSFLLLCRHIYENRSFC